MNTNLRQRAEDVLDTNPELTPVLPTSDLQKLIHELQVHQVELEVQNEELRLAQSELALSRDAYAELYDFAPLGYMTLDRHGSIQEANHGAAALLGVERRALTGRKLSDFVQHDAQDAWFLMRRQMLLSDEQQTLELALYQQDNSPLIARLDIRPFFGAAPEPWRAMVTMIDISAQKFAEHALQAAHDNQERLIETRTAELQKSERRLRQMSGKLATAEDDERRRIAEGLHDDVAQLLAACSLMLGAAAKADDSEQRNAIVDDIDGYLREAGEKVRSLSFELASATLYRLGLRDALNERCETMNAQHESQFTLTAGPPIEKMDKPTATALLRATRELLLNVVRHAGVREARVSLTLDGDDVLLAVEDSGHGFPIQEDGQPDVGQRLGLFSIEARLLAVGGKMQIESTPGAGTRVTIRVPMKPRNMANDEGRDL